MEQQNSFRAPYIFCNSKCSQDTPRQPPKSQTHSLSSKTKSNRHNAIGSLLSSRSYIDLTISNDIYSSSTPSLFEIQDNSISLMPELTTSRDESSTAEVRYSCADGVVPPGDEKVEIDTKRQFLPRNDRLLQDTPVLVETLLQRRLINDDGFETVQQAHASPRKPSYDEPTLGVIRSIEGVDISFSKFSSTSSNCIGDQDKLSNLQLNVKELTPHRARVQVSCYSSHSIKVARSFTGFPVSGSESDRNSTQPTHMSETESSCSLDNQLSGALYTKSHIQLPKSNFTHVYHSSQVTEQSERELEAASSAKRPPRNSLSIKERKRIAVPSSRPPVLTKAMRLWITKTEHLLDPFREDDDCWLHPSPPGPQTALNRTQRAVGKLQKAFSWSDRKGKHSIVLNYGIVHKLANHKMTKQQIDGFISKKWHLSHLCGNWTCLNPNHTTVEPGWINISRNLCFSHRSGCQHNPPCMKEKKVHLGVDSRLVDLNTPDYFVSHMDNEANEDSSWTEHLDEDDEYDHSHSLAEKREGRSTNQGCHVMDELANCDGGHDSMDHSQDPLDRLGGDCMEAMAT